MKNYVELLARGSFFVFVMYFLGTISGYALRLFLARNLSLADFGLFYALLAFTSLFVLFRDLGLSTTMVKFIAAYKAKKKLAETKSVFLTGLYIQLLIGIAVMLPVIIFAGPIAANYFKTPAAAMPLVVLATAYIASIFFSVQYVFQGLGKIRHYAVVEPLRNLLTLAAAVLLVPLGLVGVASSYLIAAVVALLAVFWLLLKIFPFFSLKSHITAAGTKRLLRFSVPVFIGAIAGTFLSYTDTLVLTYFRPLEDVALYNAALPTAQLLWVVVSSLSIVLLPLASELWAKGEKDVLSKISHISIKLSFVAIMPLIIVLIAFPEIFLRLLFGEAYVPAALVLQVLALNAAFYTLYTISATVLFGIGKPKTNMGIYVSMAILNLTGNIMLVPLLGISGAAVSTAASYLAGTIISLFCLEKNLRVKIPAVSLLKAFLGGAITLVILFFLKGALSTNPWIELAVSASVGFAFYCIFLFFSGVLEKEDIRLLSSVNVKLPRFLLRIAERLAK